MLKCLCFWSGAFIHFAVAAMLVLYYFLQTYFALFLSLCNLCFALHWNKTKYRKKKDQLEKRFHPQLIYHFWKIKEFPICLSPSIQTNFPRLLHSVSSILLVLLFSSFSFCSILFHFILSFLSRDLSTFWLFLTISFLLITFMGFVQYADRHLHFL